MIIPIRVLKTTAQRFLPWNIFRDQFDQRADSAAQCIQLISKGDRPLIRTAKVYMLYGDITAEELKAIKKYVINPVEAREAALEKPLTLCIKIQYTRVGGNA